MNYSLSGFCHLALKACLPFALMVLITSCCPPIWSKMKKRAEAEIAAKALMEKQKVLATGHFKDVLQYWMPEAEDRYRLSYLEADSSLDIKASKGLTLWYKLPFEGDIRIQYEACVVDGGDLLDRVSDLNCFWMASDPVYPDSIFARKHFRESSFGRYYSLQLYYMGFGGNQNTTTRFRRYDGNYDDFHKNMKRPEVLSEYKDPAHLIRPNHWYTIEITVQHGSVRYIQDGEVLVDYTDSSPLTKGWFGIRTTESHLRVRKFVVNRL